MTLPKITKIQLNLIKQLISFRYLTRLQFQNYLGHKTKRQTNRHLKILREKGYIRNIKGDNRLGFLDLAIFALGPTGIRLMRQIKDLTHEQIKNRYKDPTRSQTLVDHQLLLVEIFLHFKKEAERQKINLNFQTKEAFEEGSVFKMLHPDAFVIKEKEVTRHYFFEIIDPGILPQVWRRRIRSFVKYFLNNSVEAETGGSYPAVLVICPNEGIKNNLLKYAAEYMEEQGAEDMTIKATTKKQVIEQRVTSNIWTRVSQEV